MQIIVPTEGHICLCELYDAYAWIFFDLYLLLFKLAHAGFLYRQLLIIKSTVVDTAEEERL